MEVSYSTNIWFHFHELQGRNFNVNAERVRCYRQLLTFFLTSIGNCNVYDTSTLRTNNFRFSLKLQKQNIRGISEDYNGVLFKNLGWIERKAIKNAFLVDFSIFEVFITLKNLPLNLQFLPEFFLFLLK